MRVLALLILALVACNPDSSQTGLASGPTGVVWPTGSSSSAGSSSSTDSSSSTTSTSSTSTSTSSSSAPWPDAGTPPDFGQPQPEGCKGKIDFLFMISRLSTMVDKQSQILPSLDGFITTIQEEFADFDSHIMVGNPDGYWTGTTCEDVMCPKYGNCGPNAPDYVCGTTYDSLCDIEIGAGILHNACSYATNHPCELAGGRRYIVTKEEPNLLEQFKCIATVGICGRMPPMMKAIAAAVAPEINAEGGCNAGFLRPDALLVIVMIMDSWDYKSYVGPTKWFNAIVASKGGDTDAIVMVGILPPLTADPVPDCEHEDPADIQPNKLRLLTEMFPHHVLADICADSYAPALAEAATLVKSACGSFIPQ